jgi:hypothetical protein
VTDVAAWLRGLGLGQYEAAFRGNDVDTTVLPSLTAEDLKEIGVASVGHRRRLLDAIAALRGQHRLRRARCRAGVGGAFWGGAARRWQESATTRRARRGAAAAHGAVLRPRGLDRALGPPRPEDLREVMAPTTAR